LRNPSRTTCRLRTTSSATLARFCSRRRQCGIWRSECRLESPCSHRCASWLVRARDCPTCVSLLPKLPKKCFFVPFQHCCFVCVGACACVRVCVTGEPTKIMPSEVASEYSFPPEDTGILLIAIIHMHWLNCNDWGSWFFWVAGLTSVEISGVVIQGLEVGDTRRHRSFQI
jgi:hypothetical protein